LTSFTVDILNSSYASVDGILFNKSQTILIIYPNGKPGVYSNPTSVTSIGNYAFFGCSSLTSITISDSVTTIGSAAFLGCSSLTKVVIGNYAKSIEEEAFRDCSNLTNVIIGNGVITIGDGAFKNCIKLTIITIPDSVTTIGSAAFYRCSSLTNVVIGSSVTSIGYSAFSGCSSLANVTIPDRVTSIRSDTFDTCSSLTNVVIGYSVTSIGDLAFSGCSKLTTVFFQGNAPSLGSLAFIGTRAGIYYLPGTTGWGPTYGGRPTALWNPEPTYTQWAQANGLATRYPNASGEANDPDLDGSTNLAEMRAGTDPTNPNSALKFETTPRPADLAETDKTPIPTDRHALYIQTVPGKTYTIQATDAFGGPWQTETAATATTAQKRILLTKPAAQRFYRLLIQQ
jgi:hypothetical protein